MRCLQMNKIEIDSSDVPLNMKVMVMSMRSAKYAPIPIPKSAVESTNLLQTGYKSP